MGTVLAYNFQTLYRNVMMARCPRLCSEQVGKSNAVAKKSDPSDVTQSYSSFLNGLYSMKAAHVYYVKKLSLLLGVYNKYIQSHAYLCK